MSECLYVASSYVLGRRRSLESYLNEQGREEQEEEKERQWREPPRTLTMSMTMKKKKKMMMKVPSQTLPPAAT
jgi:hypothetical protein